MTCWRKRVVRLGRGLRGSAVAGLLALGAASTVASAGTASAHLESLTPITLQLKWRHQFQAAGFYAAIDQGYYRDAGLAVVLREPDPGEDPADVVRAGRAQYGVGTSELIIQRSRGWPIVALAAIYQHSPQILLARHDAGIETVHGLAGKTVMIEPQAADILAYLRDEHVPIDSLHQVPHSFDPASLIDGEVDAMTAYSTDEPFLLREAGIVTYEFAPRAGGIDFYGDTLFTTEAEIETYPGRVLAFVEASRRGWRYALDHPEEIADLILARYSRRHSRDHLLFEARESAPLIAASIVEFGYMNPGRWRYIADTYASLGFMTSDVDLDAFLWSPNRRPDLRWVYAGLGFGSVMVLIAALLTWRFHRFNVALRAEIAERRATEVRLSESEERYRLLVETTPFPVVIIRLGDDAIRFVNPSGARKLGIERDSVDGYHWAGFCADPADRDHFTSLLRAWGHIEAFEARLQPVNRDTFWAELSATLFTYGVEPCAFVAFTDVTIRKDMEASLRHLADTDPLTGLWNRRSFSDRLSAEQARVNRSGRGTALISIDLDEFKEINDRLGHPVGDLVLQHVARTIRNALRQRDSCARLGGEEFAAVLPDTDTATAAAVAETLRAQVERTPLVTSNATIPVTISLGVAEMQPGADAEMVFARADSALYRAKADGRNRVAVAEP